MSNDVLHAIFSTAIAYPILSLFEYSIHRHLMHSPRLARVLKTNTCGRLFFSMLRRIAIGAMTCSITKFAPVEP
jgi:hypothetical protein